jgi:hypothetical protein
MKEIHLHFSCTFWANLIFLTVHFNPEMIHRASTLTHDQIKFHCEVRGGLHAPTHTLPI